ncbi:MAG: ROK family protein [Clostridium sp.]|nr:ROK family protein [Clostridium sp.]MCM1399807.1 ROK family protein [Clostridium sp.]MCM1459566.1 ROK family protein [Bacteroides sp.]
MYLVFDIGGTFIKYAIMDGDGNISVNEKYPTPIDAGHGVNDLLDGIEQQYRSLKQQYDIEGIAVSLPGQIDIENGIVYGGGILKYLDRVKLGARISKRCDNLRVSLENDGKCAALCEAWLGNASDSENAYVLVIGTGIGGGMIINHHVHHGSSFMAGEVSYVIDNMKRNQVDSIRTAETIQGLSATLDSMPYSMSARCSTGGICNRVSKLKGMNIKDISGELIYKWASEGDEQIADVLEDWYFEIAKACVNIYCIFNPDIILIGGGISAQPLFVEGIQKYVDKLKKLTYVLNNIKVDVCKYRNRSNLFGAVMNFKQLYKE